MTGGENENECTAGGYFSACGWNDIIQDSILVNGIVHSGQKNGKNGTEYKGILSNFYHYFPQVILKFGTLH